MIKVLGPTKKEFFSPGESRAIQMSMPKFPKAEPLKQAITAYDTGLVTFDQIVSLHRVWPKDSDLFELERQNGELTENEIWDKAEKYMLDLIYPSSLYNRLTVWVFKSEFTDDKIWMDRSIEAMGLLFNFLETNTTMYKVLGMALAVGNIMNGGTAKGRSDGYELAVFSKLNTTKDNSQRSMLQFIMKKLTDADPELPNRYKEENKVWGTKATDLDSISKKYNDTNLSLSEAEVAHKAITESGEDKDKFSTTTGGDL